MPAKWKQGFDLLKESSCSHRSPCRERRPPATDLLLLIPTPGWGTVLCLGAGAPAWTMWPPRESYKSLICIPRMGWLLFSFDSFFYLTINKNSPLFESPNWPTGLISAKKSIKMMGHGKNCCNFLLFVGLPQVTVFLLINRQVQYFLKPRLRHVLPMEAIAEQC